MPLPPPASPPVLAPEEPALPELPAEPPLLPAPLSCPEEGDGPAEPLVADTPLEPPELPEAPTAFPELADPALATPEPPAPELAALASEPLWALFPEPPPESEPGVLEQPARSRAMPAAPPNARRRWLPSGARRVERECGQKVTGIEGSWSGREHVMTSWLIDDRSHANRT
ncbi:MAG: hypothetical protein M3O50_07830 [Myxococcota bacterium]|nr:hypothetical protein [Myxococcota bacterium]